MSLVATPVKGVLSLRIQNGQTSSGAWRYKNVDISGIKADLDLSDTLTLNRIGAVYNMLVSVVDGAADGMRFVRTDTVAFSS